MPERRAKRALRGCLEAYVGGWAIAERAREQIENEGTGGDSVLATRAANDDITAEDVASAFREGDVLAEKLIEETGRYLAAAAVGIVNMFNPSLLVLGGGVIEGLPELTDSVEEAIEKHAFEPFAAAVRVARAALGNDAGVVGAAAFARRKHAGVPPSCTV